MISFVDRYALRKPGISAHPAPAAIPADDHRNDQDRPRPAGEEQARGRRGDRPEVELALASDVEEVHPEGRSGGETGEEKRRGPGQGL